MPKLIKIQNPKFIDDVKNIVDVREEFIYSEKIQNKLIENTDIESKHDIGITIDSCVFNNVTFMHYRPERIKKRNGEDLIDRADSIEYQDNDIFGRISLHGVTKEKNVIHNLLFPQLE